MANGNGKTKYPQSVSFRKLFPWLGEDVPDEPDDGLHLAMKKYAKSNGNGNGNHKDSFSRYIERWGIYSDDFMAQCSTDKPQKPTNSEKYNGHRGGKYPRSGR